MTHFARLSPALLALVLSAPFAEAGGGGYAKYRSIVQGSAKAYSKGGATAHKPHAYGAPRVSVGKSSHTWKSTYPAKSSHNWKGGAGFELSLGGSPWNQCKSSSVPGPSYPHFGQGYGGHKVWVPGQWVAQKQKTWVPGVAQQVWHPAVFETHFDPCGGSFKVQLSAGHYETVTTPGHWEWKSHRVWSPAHWEYTH